MIEIKILIFTSLYPNCVNPVQGIFVYRKWKKFQELFTEVKTDIVTIQPKIKSMSRSNDTDLPPGNIITYPTINQNKRIFQISTFLLAYVLIFIKGILTLMKKNFDCAVVEWANPLEILIALIISKIKRKRLVIIPKGSDIRILPFKISIYLVLMRILLRNSDLIQVNSKNMKNILIKYYDIKGEKISINYEGFSKEIHREKLDCRVQEEVLDSYREKGYHLCGMIGSFDHVKMQIELIESLSRIDDKNIVIFFIGKGGNERVKRAKAAGDYYKVTERIVFTGELDVPCLKVFLEKIQIFFHLSRSEGFPVSILEEMSFGDIVIGSPVGGIPEILSDGAGILIEENTIDCIVETTNKIFSGYFDLDNISKNAKSKSWGKYTLELQVNRLYQVLMKICESKN